MSDTGPIDEQAEARIAELRRRWEEKPSPRVGLQLAEELRRASHLPEAQEVLEHSLEQNPGHLSSLVALGKTRLGLGDAAGAAQTFDEVVDRDPTHLVANKLLIEAHLEQGDTDSALRRLEHYRLLGAGDPEIEAMEQRLAEATDDGDEPAADAALEAEPESAQPESDEPETGSGELDGAATASVSELSTDFEAARADSTPAPVVRAAGDSVAGEPFPALGHGDRLRYLEGLQGAGIFPLPEELPSAAEAEEVGDTAADSDSEPATDEAVTAAAGDTPQDEALDVAVPDLAEGGDELAAAEPDPLEEPVADPEPEVAEQPEPEPELAATPELPAAEPADSESESDADSGAQAAAADDDEGDAAVAAPDDEKEHATITLGELYLSQGHPGEAARVFRQVLARDPDDSAATAGLATALSQQQERALTAPALLQWAVERQAIGESDAEGDRRSALLEAYRARLKSRARSEGEERTDVP